VVKVEGSWVTEDTPAKKYIEYSLSACWENLLVFKSYELTDLFHCISLKAKGKVSYETALLYQCGTACLYIYCMQNTSK